MEFAFHPFSKRGDSTSHEPLGRGGITVKQPTIFHPQRQQRRVRRRRVHASLPPKKTAAVKVIIAGNKVWNSVGANTGLVQQGLVNLNTGDVSCTGDITFGAVAPC
jgi:hypothetical protein